MNLDSDQLVFRCNTGAWELQERPIELRWGLRLECRRTLNHGGLLAIGFIVLSDQVVPLTQICEAATG